MTQHKIPKPISDVYIKQDIYCNLIFYNMQTVRMLDSEKALQKLNEKRKNKPSKNKRNENNGCQINRNIGTGILRLNLCDLFTCKEKDLAGVLENLQLLYLQSIEPIRDCNKERKRKMHRSNDRHHTELNYKRGF